MFVYVIEFRDYTYDDLHEKRTEYRELMETFESLIK